MITLFDIMQLECMNNTKIIAGPKTFHQSIENIAMLDYEPLEKRYDVFLENEFVLTSLLFARNDSKLIKEAILELVNRNVSAIAIQKLYDFEFDEETINIVNQSNTTILIYRDAYMEEIIGSVKHLLYKHNDETKYENYIQQLINTYSIDETTQSITLELIPIHWEMIRCHLVEPDKHDSFLIALYQLRKSFGDKLVRIYKYQYYYLVIENVKEEYIHNHSYNYYAISDVVKNNECCYAIKQALQAMDYAHKYHINRVYYSDMKSEIFTYAVKENWLIQEYCKKQLNKIKNHDETYSTNLMQTLLCYIKCHGDAKQCGNELYQHPNTIRYRIGKIKETLDLVSFEEKEVYEYLFMLVNFKNDL